MQPCLQKSGDLHQKQRRSLSVRGRPEQRIQLEITVQSGLKREGQEDSQAHQQSARVERTAGLLFDEPEGQVQDGLSEELSAHLLGRTAKVHPPVLQDRQELILHVAVSPALPFHFHGHHPQQLRLQALLPMIISSYDKNHSSSSMKVKMSLRSMGHLVLYLIHSHRHFSW